MFCVRIVINIRFITKKCLKIILYLEELWQSCIGESQEETASEEETESATSTPAPAPTEPTTESQESEATEPPASKRFLLEKLLRNVQLELKRSEAFKHPYHRSGFDILSKLVLDYLNYISNMDFIIYSIRSQKIVAYI